MAAKFQPFQILYQHVKTTDPRLYQAFDTISQSLQNLQAGSSVSTIAGGITLYAQTLTANITVPSPVTPSNGVVLLVLLIQNATGGHTVAWDASFGTVPDIGPLDANSYSALIFVGFNARWYLISAILNQLP